LRNITKHSTQIKFADDLLSIMPLEATTKDASINLSRISHDLGALIEYFANNDILLNCGKSSALIVGKNEDVLLRRFINDSGLALLDTLPYLGFFIDADLKMKSQVSIIAKHMGHGILALRHLAENTSIRNMIQFYHGHFQSYLLYSSFALLRCRSTAW
jgi:hypothetical protein